jgi:hypothetical protein
MKKIQTILVAMMLLVGSFASAAVIPFKDKKTATTEEIRSLLTDPSFTVETDTTAFVTFMLNTEGEMIVLTVDTDNAVVESYVKARLNYHKLSTPLEKGKEYKVPILLKA